MFIPPTDLDREIYVTQKLQEMCQLQGAKIQTFHYGLRSTIWSITNIPDNPTGDFIRDRFKDLLDKTFHAGKPHKKVHWSELIRQVNYSYGIHKKVEETLTFEYSLKGTTLIITWKHSRD